MHPKSAISVSDLQFFPWLKETLPITGFLWTLMITVCIYGGSAGKESTCNVRDLGSVSGLGRSPGKRNSCPLQYSSLENSMDCIVHGITKSWAQLSDFYVLLTWIYECLTYNTDIWWMLIFFTCCSLIKVKLVI